MYFKLRFQVCGLADLNPRITRTLRVICTQDNGEELPTQADLLLAPRRYSLIRHEYVRAHLLAPVWASNGGYSLHDLPISWVYAALVEHPCFMHLQNLTLAGSSKIPPSAGLGPS